MTTDDGAAPAPSDEMFQKMTEFANAVGWKRPDLNVLRPELDGQYPPVAEAIQKHLELSDWRKRLVLPNLRAFDDDCRRLQRLRGRKRRRENIRRTRRSSAAGINGPLLGNDERRTATARPRHEGNRLQGLPHGPGAALAA